ncbi:MAG: NAD(P)-dependent alcohol dehydrogenase [Anaerolineae bacterium]|nr:NAD(P)-dependent alcohol dehydrogenase [Anaerolineae bacterium]
MKAVVYERYGPPEVLHLAELPKPTPRENEVLIRVRATTVTIGDTRMRSFTVPREQWLPARLYLGVTGPRRKVLGMELAGDVAAVGARITRFKVGDPVFASTFEVGFGGYAEYFCIAEDGVLAIKPANLTYEEAAAAVGGGITAMRCLRKGRIQPGHKVLIYGASGAVGTNAVQLVSRHYRAEVTAVCSAANGEWIKALGAAHVLDYAAEDFTQDGPIYDVVFDAVARFSPARARMAVKAGGVYLNVHRDSEGEKGRDMRQDLLDLKALIEAGTLRPVIDRCYPMEQIVEAHHYVDLGHKKGNVAIRMGPEN